MIMEKCLKKYCQAQIELYVLDARDVLTASDPFGVIAAQLDGGNDDAWNITYR